VFLAVKTAFETGDFRQKSPILNSIQGATPSLLLSLFSRIICIYGQAFFDFSFLSKTRARFF